MSRFSESSGSPEGWIDGHSHLADPRFGDSLSSVLERSRTAGVVAWIQGGYDPSDWDRQARLAFSEPGFFPTYGLHPWWVSAHSDSECEAALELLDGRLDDGLAVGLGELGLDFGEKRLSSETETADEIRARQLRVFERQLALATGTDLPLVLHIVHAHEPALELLRKTRIPTAGGIVHSYSGSAELAREYLQLGLSLSFSGAITRKGFESVKKAVVSVPRESLVIETDSPDQAPVDFGGPLGLNEPSSLMRVAQAVGALREEAPEAVLEASRANLIRVFGGHLKSFGVEV